ncbi:MAG: hypothetical protein JSV30_00095 [Candidatus Omnitrophota bacterium]|nr:MAG: hypothetical protein JSV30_00095 [Candidatus Omnitrophota bacterium]
MGKIKNIIVTAIVLFIGLILFSAIKSILEGEEGRLRRLIYSAKRAIEKEDLIRSIFYVSFDYQDKYGNDRSRLFLIGKGLVAEYDNISIKITELEIDIKGENALVEIEALAYGQRQGLEVIEYDKAKLKVHFKKEEGKWKIIELEFLQPEDILYLPGIAQAR